MSGLGKNLLALFMCRYGVIQ